MERTRSGPGAAGGLWLVGAVRLLLLAVIATGGFYFAESRASAHWLFVFYGFGAFSTVGYLFALYTRRGASMPLTWTQILVDFSVVAATVSFTGGSSSFFAFLYVVVILEAGRLLGMREGITIATLAVAASLAETLWGGARDRHGLDLLGSWYNFVVQMLAFYLTAFISGYWTQQVNRLRQFQREILDNMNNGFLITDLEGAVVAINQAALRILGLEEDDALGEPIDNVLRVEDDGECPVVTALRADRDFTSYEFMALGVDSAPILLGLTTSRVYDAHRRPTGLIASFTDLTEIAQMREELKRQDRLAVVGELAAGLAHEIRNPLAAIRAAVEELHANIGAARLAEKLAAIAIRESDHLNQIVTGFLDFARKPSMRRETFDLRGLAEEVADAFRRQQDKSAETMLVVNVPETPCAALGDRSQIKQVFSNITRNGIEAMNDAGTLTITLQTGAGYVEARFDDEGPGLEPDKVARIFEPFYTTKDTGTGMGLAVCMRIVTAHDGTIRAVSRPTRGASFIVRLPAAKQKEEAE